MKPDAGSFFGGPSHCCFTSVAPPAGSRSPAVASLQPSNERPGESEASAHQINPRSSWSDVDLNDLVIAHMGSHFVS